ncbi:MULTISPECIES: glycoside hydrolase family 9 protein [unclassified Arenibacter]|uniref:glycoside hydrolase family 9 protein n=1 Tax=unclassified Arenibacter TaxID=2615047 RepID=UPI000E34C71A|nr:MULTISPECIES: glycoside hydrolase family 9 protein [unclassified Arenibacter]MCM4163852.1 glycoside hydrolase family 9 [Arenibacter sp. A80]RFT56565.1 glycoside hydrolase family 9 [Arenibacter sp. P308M17]
MKRLFFLFLSLGQILMGSETPQGPFIRINQLGYLSEEHKKAIVFSHDRVSEAFQLINDKGKVVATLRPKPSKQEGWGRFKNYYELNFSHVTINGTYFIQGKKTRSRSGLFKIGNDVYGQKPEVLLEFMRQQRCGYNPYFDMVCHQRDGRSAYGPMPDGTFVNASGGWHDAGDQLKYLITGSYATAHMLMAYELYPTAFEDRVNALGQPGPNGIADVLDEAKWGLDWILKLHPGSDQLIHQIADDRDHIGWKMPDEDKSDYGWGQNSYRVAYFTTGTPQGLNKYKSEASGVSNLAGRSAAALALAARIWLRDVKDSVFAQNCLAAAKSLYKLGKEKEGFQQGNSYGAPYRYSEKTWADDMEWGAAELYKSTGNSSYLREAKEYALKANTVSWTPMDSVGHYEYYPFVNLGHFALFDEVDDDFKNTLAAYYKSGLEDNLKRASKNAYNIGVPFIWCSNNLLSSLITQGILYEKMTGDKSYRSFLVEQRDWLFGRNPWGTSMFTKIPENGEYPVDVHTSTWALTKKEVAGGLVDGPVYASIFNSLKGLRMDDPDEFEAFQNKFVVYHDDVGDYSTNEPTMDGTAGSIIMMAHWAAQNKN